MLHTNKHCIPTTFWIVEILVLMDSDSELLVLELCSIPNIRGLLDKHDKYQGIEVLLDLLILNGVKKPAQLNTQYSFSTNETYPELVRLLMLL